MTDSTPATAACHCGRPATDTEFVPNMGDYCDDCSLARCDIISGVDCPHYQPPATAATVTVELTSDQQEALRALWDLMPYLDALASDWYDMLPVEFRKVVER